jgi:hypothetical protein
MRAIPVRPLATGLAMSVFCQAKDGGTGRKAKAVCASRGGGRTMEKGLILVYLGPSLPLAKAREILPNAIYRPPARQGDIVTDIVTYSPSRIILIDGEFRQNLSVWHKEIVYALQYPGIKAIYGASSIGALRAAELDYLGMIGIGQIYQWYRDGVTEDDSEVALSYTARDSLDGPIYFPSSVPLVDIRAAVEHYEREFPGEPVAIDAREFLENARKIFYTERTPQQLQILWDARHGVSFPRIEQKRIDAVHALNDFASYEAKVIERPNPDHLSGFFQALYDRDRRISINGIEVPQQHIDSHVLLHNPEWERICWDSSNQELALLLCDLLCVMVSVEDIGKESQRFQNKSEIKTEADFHTFLENNGWSVHEYDRLMIENARIRKLQHHLSVSKGYRRNTRAIIDYLRTHQAFDYWAIQAAQVEQKLRASGADDWLSINLETPPLRQLLDHFEKEGLELTSTPEEYLLETGFSNMAELGVAVQRTTAAKED